MHLVFESTPRTRKDIMPTDQDSQKEELQTDTAATALAALDISGDVSEVKTGEGGEDDDEDLFKPPPPKDECALCFLPLPNVTCNSVFFLCCGKRVCDGCNLKNDATRFWSNCKRAMKDPPEPEIKKTCAFCREPAKVFSGEEHLQCYQKRMDMNDARAFHSIASDYARGDFGLPKDMDKAVELYLRAVELGLANACYNISRKYRAGGFLGFDKAKEKHFLKLAAKRGHVDARCNLGLYEYKQGNVDLGVKHLMISAAAGCDVSLKMIGTSYRSKSATKDQFEEALRAHEKAKKDMSSKERDMAKKYEDGGKKWRVFSKSELAELFGARKRNTKEFDLFSSFYEFVHRKEYTLSVHPLACRMRFRILLRS